MRFSGTFERATEATFSPRKDWPLHKSAPIYILKELWTPKCCENCLLCIAHLLVVVYIACAKNFSLFPHAMQYLSLSKKKTEYQKVFAPIIPKSTNNCFFLKRKWKVFQDFYYIWIIWAFNKWKGGQRKL